MKPMIFAGALCGLLVCIVVGSILWLLGDPTPTNNNLSVKPEIPKVSIVQPEKLTELTFGGRVVLPNYRFVALYGNPDFPTLGSLGEQDIDGSISRINSLVSQYQTYSEEKFIPTFEIIATIASAQPTENQDYSQELAIEKIKPWLETAKQNKIYVVLDLQTGRSSFLDQAKIYEELLKDPNVGLALDPEWRLQSMDDRHLKKVGSVNADEINATSEWLADIVKTNKLPQKLFMVHQFKLSMITDRQIMKTNREELAYVIHMDGHGELGQKIDTLNNIFADFPKNTYIGWKNFYDEDKPTPTPEQTMSQTPKPVFVSYQ